MSGSERRTRIAFVGWGAISRRAHQILITSQAPVDVVAVGVRSLTTVRADLPDGAAIINRPEELPTGLDLVVEAAGRATVEPWGAQALRSGVDFAVSSTSAFCDDALLARLLDLASASGARIVTPPGALGGIDALAAGALAGLDEVTHEIVKPPLAWLGTPAESLINLDDLAGEETFFEGSAREGAARFPQNANAAVITALAGIGLDRTRLVLRADPKAERNGHTIRATGAFGTMEVRLENAPLATNPKSSELTALNLARMIVNRTAPMVV